MTNIANEQLFELVVLLITAIVYIISHYACSGLAILISGQKSGVIRGFVQGILLVVLFAISIIFFFNWKLKIYHIVTYAGFVFAFLFSIKQIAIKVQLNVTRKHNK